MYETKPFKVAFVIYGEALVFATSDRTAKMKVQEMTPRRLVEKSLTAESEIIDLEAEKEAQA